MIQIDKPLVVSQTQTYRFCQVKVEAAHNGGMIATVIFNAYGDNDLHLGQQVISYEGKDFDHFWSNFTSGKFLYQEFVTKQNLGVTVPDAVEDEFKGVISNGESKG